MTKVCQWCEKEFNSTIRNQVYCSSECRISSTKQKISQRYQQSKFRSRVNKERRCAGGCNTLLSVYNDSKFCDQCLVNNKQFDKLLKEIKGYFDYEKE